MSNLDKILNALEMPETRASLKSDILKAAQAQKSQAVIKAPANDNKMIWMSAMAACFLFIAVMSLSFMQTSEPDITETEQWAEAAEVIGYSDLYEWVNEAEPADESDVQYN